MPMYLGVDIGGSKIILAVFDEFGKVVEQKRFDTPKGYKDAVAVINREINHLKEQDITIAAFAVPGRFDHTNGMGLGFGTLHWQNVPILQDLKAGMACPVIIENDAKIAALSEASLLNDGNSRILYITVSNGIGGGLIINGHIDHTMRDSEFGSMVFPHNNTIVRWEDFASGRSIVERFGKRLSEIITESELKIIGEDISIGLIACCAGVQADIVIFGGGAGQHLDRCFPYIEDFLEQYLHPAIKRPQLRIAKYPEDAVINGCYVLAKSALAI
jgi:glucokinase